MTFKRQIETICQSQSGQNGGKILKKTTGSVIGDKEDAKKTNEGTENCLPTYLFNPKKRQYVCARHRKSFTLIERVPSKAGRISLVKSPDPTNCSFQVGSLTVGAHGNMRARRTVTKPPEGKSACYGGTWPVPKALTGNGEKQIAGHLTQG